MYEAKDDISLPMKPSKGTVVPVWNPIVIGFPIQVK